MVMYNMTRKINWGIIGLGKIANKFLTGPPEITFWRIEKEFK